MIKKEHILITLATTLVLVCGFYGTDQYMALQMLKGKLFWNPSFSWDHAIPFAPSWIWVYLLYFPACFLPVVLAELWTDRGIFRRTAAGFIFQFAAAFAFFWVLPTQMHRPLFEVEGLHRQVLSWFYGVDPGFNIFPSLHVANVAYIACLAWGLNRAILSVGVWVLCLLIAASTLLIKQHCLVDLPLGLALGVAGYFAAFSKGLNFLDPRKVALAVLPIAEPVLLARKARPVPPL
jgi:membrane-associated phospholipid phosphatase